MEYLVFGARVAIAGVFIISGLGKARAMVDTIAMVRELLTELRISSGGVIRLAAAALVAVELLAGMAILVGSVVAVGGLLTATVLLVGFITLAVASARGRLRVRCACFGNSSARLGWRHVWRNLALLSIALVGLAGVIGSPPWPSEVGGIAVTVVAAGVVVLLTGFFDDILDVVTG